MESQEAIEEGGAGVNNEIEELDVAKIVEARLRYHAAAEEMVEDAVAEEIVEKAAALPDNVEYQTEWASNIADEIDFADSAPFETENKIIEQAN